MGDTIPKTTKLWRVTGYDGFDSLKFTEEPVPELGDSEVLVKSECVTVLSETITDDNGFKFVLHP